MLFRFLIHLVFVLVFLFGSTFSCSAFINQETGHGHHNETLQEKTPDNCCPKDGHKKQIESKNITQTLQKQGFDIEPFIPRVEKIFYGDKSETKYHVSYYKNPPYDRQQLFFTETIKLLL